MPTLTPLVSNPSAPISKVSFLYFLPRHQQAEGAGLLVWSYFLNDPFFKISEVHLTYFLIFALYKPHHLKTFRKQVFTGLPLCQTGGTEDSFSEVDADV